MRSISVRSFSKLFAVVIAWGLVLLGCDSQGPSVGKDTFKEKAGPKVFSLSPSTVNLNTGFDQDTNTLIGLGQEDDDWFVTSVPSSFSPPLPGGTFSAVVPDSSPWQQYRGFNPLTNARWISVNEDGADDLVGGFTPGGNDFRFDYEREFTLPCCAAAGSLAVKPDDKALEVRLNGNLVASNISGAPGDRMFSLSPTHFQSGINRLKIKVQDNGGIVTGLAVSGNLEYVLATIDIKPGSSENPINLSSSGPIPVAILSPHPSHIDASSLRFGDTEDVKNGGGADPEHGGHIEDIDNDGSDDLLLHFPTQDAGFEGDEEKGKVLGETISGTPLCATDSLTFVGGGDGNSGNGNGPN